MKLCVVFPKLSHVGGSEKAMVHTIKLMKEKGWDITIITEALPNRDLYRKLYNIDLDNYIDTWIRMGSSGFFVSSDRLKIYQKIRTIKQIEKTIKNGNFDLMFISQATMPRIDVKIPKIGFVWCPLTKKGKDYRNYTSNWCREIRGSAEESPKDYFLVAYSEWIQKNVKKVWHADSEVIYPPCSISKNKITKKENMVCSLSRFHHGKKHDVILKIAEEMPELEFHLIGIATTKDYKNYLDQLKKAAPVNCHFHVNLDGNEKNRIIARSRYAIHTTGYGEEKNDLLMHEHFGIAVAEMMSHGCILQHHNTGFFPEYVLDKKQTFSSIKEGVDNIRFFEANAEIAEETAKRNFEKSKKYSNENFEKNLNKFIDGLKINQYNR